MSRESKSSKLISSLPSFELMTPYGDYTISSTKGKKGKMGKRKIVDPNLVNRLIPSEETFLLYIVYNSKAQDFIITDDAPKLIKDIYYQHIVEINGLISINDGIKAIIVYNTIAPVNLINVGYKIYFILNRDLIIQGKYRCRHGGKIYKINNPCSCYGSCYEHNRYMYSRMNLHTLEGFTGDSAMPYLRKNLYSLSFD